MYAIIRIGAKQYKVTSGDMIEVEKLTEETGKDITLKEVLLLSDKKGIKVGQPHVSGSKVICEVLGQRKKKKAIVFKFRRRKDSKTKKGHRQVMTRLRVKDIAG